MRKEESEKALGRWLPSIFEPCRYFPVISINLALNVRRTMVAEDGLEPPTSSL